MTDIVVLIPGIMGSVLKKGADVIWPGPVSSLWFPYNKMDELLSEDLVATDCIRSVSISVQYQSLIDDLEQIGFKENDGTLLVAAYDWRLDNAMSAASLADRLDAAVAKHGAQTRINLIGHSMGGLVARYYLESGKFSARPAFGKVALLVTIGTPHTGASIALALVLGHEKRLFLSGSQIRTLARSPKFPSAYQLLPPPEEPFVYDRTKPTFPHVSIYDPEVALSLGLVAENLNAAKAFRSGISLAKRPASVRYFTFAGTRQSTATHVILRMQEGGLTIDRVEQQDGGDGTVPTWSGFVPEQDRLFVGGEHSVLYRDRMLWSVLRAVLGHPDDHLVGLPSLSQIALRDRVVTPNSQVAASIRLGRPTSHFQISVTIERLETAQDGSTSFSVGGPVEELAYQGLELESLSVLFAAPGREGVYRVHLRDSPTAPPMASDELFVQKT